MEILKTSPFRIHLKMTRTEAERMGASKTNKSGVYTLPTNADALQEVYDATGNREIHIAAQRKKHNQIQASMLKKKEDAPGISRLRPYQRVDVAFLKRLKAAGIFNEQRTGKTPTLLSLLDPLERNLIIVPASLVYQWDQEVQNWMCSETCVISTSKAKREKLYKEFNQGVMIIGYETFRSDWLKGSALRDRIENGQFDSLTLDEAHRLAGRKSKQTRSIHQAGLHVEKRYALTGTPARNHPSDIWGILAFLYPNVFTSYWAFSSRYWQLNQNFYGGWELGKPQRNEELMNILDQISVQRKRKDVMKWLPDKQYQVHKLDFHPKQKEVYKEVLETFEYEEDGELKVDASGILPQLTRLRQICLSPEMLDINAPSVKEKWLQEWLSDNDEPVVIFSSFTSYLKKLNEKLEGSVMIHGEMSAAEKQSAAETFQNGTGGTRILLANVIAAGTGFTLDKAEVTIFLDRHFTPTVNEQAEDRMVSTQEAHVTSNTVIDLLVSDSIDEHVHGLLERKQDLLKDISDYKVFLDKLRKDVK